MKTQKANRNRSDYNMPEKINMLNKRFGKLTVIKELERTKRGSTWLCKCDCGGTKIANGRDLRSGHVLSCGCLHKFRHFKHGMSSTRPSTIYRNMKKRCDNPNCPDYKNYGGRGITYCDRWKTFEGFWEDMKEGYEPNLTIDRIDNDKGYCKENCRWVTRREQDNNKRTNHYVIYKGQKYTLAQLGRLLKLDAQLILDRLRTGKSLDEAIKPPKQAQKVFFNGSYITLSDLAHEHGMTYIQLKKRLMRGWTIERAVNQPLRNRFNI